MIYYNDFFYFGEIPVQFLLQIKMSKLKISSVLKCLEKQESLFWQWIPIAWQFPEQQMLFKMKYYFLVKIDQVNATK